VALSPDEEMLYVSLGGNNALAVFRLGQRDRGPPVRRSPASAGGIPPGPPGAVDVNSLPHSAASNGGGGAVESTDPRVFVQQGSDAENRGQFPRAKKLYEQALQLDGHNSEALAGLGTVSLKQGDPATARQFFGRALAINPNYVPALVGQADALWQEGDKNGAVAKYKELVDRFPESAGYPTYVKTRAAGSSSGAVAPPAAPEAPKPAAPPGGPGGIPPGAGPPGKPGELTLPSNVPSDLPGTPP
jgi:Flp pilus assembly protein TadD